MALRRVLNFSVVLQQQILKQLSNVNLTTLGQPYVNVMANLNEP